MSTTCSDDISQPRDGHSATVGAGQGQRCPADNSRGANWVVRAEAVSDRDWQTHHVLSWLIPRSLWRPRSARLSAGSWALPGHDDRQADPVRTRYPAGRLLRRSDVNWWSAAVIRAWSSWTWRHVSTWLRRSQWELHSFHPVLNSSRVHWNPSSNYNWRRARRSLMSRSSRGTPKRRTLGLTWLWYSTTQVLALYHTPIEAECVGPTTRCRPNGK